MLSFKELEITKTCNISEACEIHSAQAGSVFPHRADALKRLEVAKDNVKYLQGKIEMETHILGKIPVNSEPTIKITGAAMTAYLNSHPEIVEARKERAEAEQHLSNILGLVTAYNAKKELLQMTMKDRNQEFNSTPRETASGVPSYL